MKKDIKMQLRTIAESSNAMNMLSNKPLPAKTSYKVSRAISKVNSIMKQFEKDRMVIFKQLGDLQADGINIQISAEKQGEFQKNMDALMDEEVMLSELTQLDISEFHGMMIEPVIFAALDWLIIEEASPVELSVVGK